MFDLPQAGCYYSQDQAEGEWMTQTGVGKDKMGVFEEVLCLFVDMVSKMAKLKKLVRDNVYV